MASARHQNLVNWLANALDSRGIQITAIDIDGAPEHFEQKFQNLPAPGQHGDSVPDLEGKDSNGVLHLGEAEVDMRAENLDSQLKQLSNRVMTNSNVPVPLHVVVPDNLKARMEAHIRNIGLGDRLASGRIRVW